MIKALVVEVPHLNMELIDDILGSQGFTVYGYCITVGVKSWEKIAHLPERHLFIEL